MHIELKVYTKIQFVILIKKFYYKPKIIYIHNSFVQQYRLSYMKFIILLIVFICIYFTKNNKDLINTDII